MQILEKPFRKDISTKKCSDLVAAPFIPDASGTVSSLQAFTHNTNCSRVIISNKSSNKQGSKYGFVKVAAVKVSIHTQLSRTEAFSLFTSHRIKMHVPIAHCGTQSSGFSLCKSDTEPGDKA